MTNPLLPQPSEPTCRKCGHPASDSVHGLFSGGCLETEAGIYRHALTEMQTRERQALDAHAHSFSALAAVSLLTDLGGEVDDYGDVAKSVEKIVDERDALRAENAKLREDAARLDWLEDDALKEAMTLHDGTLPIKGRMQTRGLGFGPFLQRSLREAIDTARNRTPDTPSPQSSTHGIEDNG